MRALLLLLAGGCIAVPMHAKTGRRQFQEYFLTRMRYEWVTVPAGDDVTLRGIYVDRGGPPVLVLYGAGMSIARSLELLEILHDGGYSSLCCDYRGCGYSSGSRGFTSRHVDDDARALWEWLLANKGEPAGVLGISLGSIAAAPLVHHGDPPAAVILDRPVDPRNVIYRWVEAYLGKIPSLIARLVARPSTDVSVHGSLARARAETLLVLPEYDVLMTPRDAEYVTKGLPANVHVVTVPGGHVSSQLVDPGAWRGAILDFLDARLRPGQPPLGGREMPEGEARVVSWSRKGRTLRVTLDREAEKAVVLVMGLERNGAAYFERPPREIEIRLSRKLRHRIFGVRTLPDGYPLPVGTDWLTDLRPPPFPERVTAPAPPDRSK
jgi:pimeloyl-ACP methyl ester carboxylesterase